MNSLSLLKAYSGEQTDPERSFCDEEAINELPDLRFNKWGRLGYGGIHGRWR